MLTEAEAKQAAARLALEAVMAVQPRAWDEGEDSLMIAVELKRIADGLRRQVCGGDKILLRQMTRELGRQVRPTGKQAQRLGLPAKGKPE